MPGAGRLMRRLILAASVGILVAGLLPGSASADDPAVAVGHTTTRHTIMLTATGNGGIDVDAFLVLR